MASACGSEPQQTVSDFFLSDSESEGEGSGGDDCEESSASDGCSAFDSDGCNKHNLLVNKRFTKWVKVNKIAGSHASTPHHISAVADASAFKQSVKQPESNINVYINTELAQSIQQNRHIVKCCAECVCIVVDSVLHFEVIKKRSAREKIQEISWL